MQLDNLEIKPYHSDYKSQIVDIWERSVRATHHFLSPSDFEEIKAFVGSMNFTELQVFCLTQQNLVLGFVVVADRKIEMLFMDPEYFGQGLGKKLLHFAISELGANKLDVNEQNIKALQFYQNSGFEIVERTDKDDQGRNYPLLRMKLVRGVRSQTPL